jgi:predicted HicB family RNase H-like nuclease
MATAAVSESAKVTVRVDPVTRRRLVAEAAAQRRTVSNLAKLLLEDALADADQVERASER